MISHLNRRTRYRRADDCETARLLEQSRVAEQHLFQSQKLAAIGVLARSIVHEVRNLLCASSSAAQFLLTDLFDPAFRRECVQKIIHGIERSSITIESLLRFARPSQSACFKQLNLVPLVQEITCLLTYQAKLQRIALHQDYTESSVPVMGNANLLQQAVLNLILNAIQAMPNGGNLSISVYREAAKAVVRVCDTGCGIAPVNLGRIFDPFFTTHPAGSGTDLGLSISDTIVKQHGGSIEMESAEGQGSTVTVSLPLAAIDS